MCHNGRPFLAFELSFSTVLKLCSAQLSYTLSGGFSVGRSIDMVSVVSITESAPILSFITCWSRCVS